MPINFFEAELEKIRKRFNETFGNLTTCSLKHRYAAILTIAWLGVLSRTISESMDKDTVRKEIHGFVQKKNTLNKLFKKIEQEIKERGCKNNEPIDGEQPGEPAQESGKYTTGKPHLARDFGKRAVS
jgi:hypothetical protein